MDSSWNIGSIGIAGPPLRGPSSARLIAEPPLSPPVSGPSPTASAQPLEPPTPLAPAIAPAHPAGFEAHPASPSPRPATSLESLLIRFRLITSDQLDEALAEKRETGKDVGAIVVERGWVNEDQLARLLSYAPAFPEQTEPADATTAEPEVDVEQQPEASEPEALETETETELEPALPEATSTAGPVISTAPETRVDAPALEAEPPHPFAHQPAPALELVEDEPAAEFEPSVVERSAPAAEPVVDAPAHALERVELVSEPALELTEAESAHAEPEPTDAEPEQAEPLAATLTDDPFAEPEPAAELEAPAQAFEPAPTPEPAPAFEPAPTPEPASTPEPVAEAAPVVVEPAAEPVATAPEPQTVHVVEPPAVETIARVFVRLSNGERVEAGSFDDIAAAKARAEEVVREVSNGAEHWPFFGGRYIRPDVIVSVDVDATVVRYA